MAKVSASNLVERAPIKGSKKADQKKGAFGFAWAHSIIEHAEAEGQRLVAEVKSRKLRLGELMKMSTEDNLMARNELTLALEKIKGEAEAAKLSLNAYCDANPKAATVRVDCSMWSKLAEAVNKGYRDTLVDLSKPWADIVKGATAHLDNMNQSTGADGKPATNAGPRARKAGRKQTPAIDRAKKFAKEVLVDEKTMAVKPDVNLAKIVGELLLRATVEQCNEVIAECVRIRDMKLNVEEELKKKAAKQSDAAKAEAEKPGNAGESGTTKAGAVVKVTKAKGRQAAPTPTVTEEKIAHAQASTGRQTYDPNTQSKLRDGTIVNVKPTRKTRAHA